MYQHKESKKIQKVVYKKVYVYGPYKWSWWNWKFLRHSNYVLSVELSAICISIKSTSSCVFKQFIFPMIYFTLILYIFCFKYRTKVIFKSKFQNMDDTTKIIKIDKHFSIDTIKICVLNERGSLLSPLYMHGVYSLIHNNNSLK